MNNAFLRGFIKAAHENGVHPLDLAKILKCAGSGFAPAVLGALPGAAAGGYLAYDRALKSQKEPGAIDPQMAATLGALGGGGLGALAGTAAGSIGYERGASDLSEQDRALIAQFANTR